MIIAEAHKVVAAQTSEQSNVHAASSLAAAATEAAPTAINNTPQSAIEQSFVGTNKCFQCHRPQTNTWSETKHAHSFTNMAEKYRADLNCIKCHATAFNQPGGYVAGTDKDLQMVGCEACHGPGARHVDAAQRFVMANPGEEAEIEKELRATVVKSPQDSVCIGCHTMQGHQPHPKYDGQVVRQMASSTTAPCSCGPELSAARSDVHATLASFSKYSAKTCGGCHYDQYRAWSAEKHFSLARDLPAKYTKDQSCLVCHPNTNLVSLPPSVSVDTKHQWVGVVCEDCHGPALQHVRFNKQFIAGPPLGPKLEQMARDAIRKSKPAQTCVQCHVRNGHKEHVAYDAK